VWEINEHRSVAKMTFTAPEGVEYFACVVNFGKYYKLNIISTQTMANDTSKQFRLGTSTTLGAKGMDAAIKEADRVLVRHGYKRSQ